MDSLRLTYLPRPEATSEQETAALASVYAFILRCHEAKKQGGPATSRPDDEKGSMNDLAEPESTG